MECPKCHHSQPDGQPNCGGCGIFFAKWEARQRLLFEQARGPAVQTDLSCPFDGDTDLVRDEAHDTFRYRFTWGLWIIGIGLIIPLIKASAIFGTNIVWPWDLFGSPTDAAKAASMATLSDGGSLTAWSSLPIGFLLLTLVFQYICSWPLSARLSSVAGTSALFLMLVYLSGENEILGLFFSPPTTAAGAIMFAGALSAMVISTTNRIWDGRLLSGAQRALLGFAGLVEGLTVSGFIVGSEGPWASWAMILFYLGAAAQGCIGIYQACKGEISADTRDAMSRLATGLLVWGAIAILIAQQTTDDPFYGWVIQGGGGFIHTLSGLLKGFALYYGIALTTMAGLHGIFRPDFSTTEAAAGSGEAT
jgi:hypothetical protein